MNDLEPRSNSLLTGDHRPAPNGEPNGAATGAPPAPPGEPPGTAPTQAPASASEPSLPSAAPASEPAPDLRWCSRCEAQVIAVDKGRCPTCRSFLKGSTVARKNPLNVAKRDAILADLIAEYKPTTTMETATCEHLAATLERLSSLRPGSTDWQRLMNASQTLSAALRSTAPTETPTAFENYTLAQLVTRAEQLLAEARRCATKPREAPFVPPPPAPRAPSPYDPPVDTDVATTPQCAYGCGPLEHCAKVKATNPEAWAAIHFNDPGEVERRRKDNFKIMMRTVKNPAL